ncbi:MAG TPA: hypothetical protein VM736_04345, partial [Gemmatimonadales bacterium]|nr:hypothetical protein [Gemmatimonadales bacterium]
WALLVTLCFGAGVGYAADLSPLLVCALTTGLVVNLSPRRHVVRQVLAHWERPVYAVVLVVTGALLTLPTWWLLLAGPLVAAARLAGKWGAGLLARDVFRVPGDAPQVGLATVAQGGVALALGLNFFLMYGGGGGGGGGSGVGVGAGGAGVGMVVGGGSWESGGGAVFATIVLAVAVAQVVATSLVALARRPRVAPLTAGPPSAELSRNAPAD